MKRRYINVVFYLLTHCGSLKPSESLVIICDQTTLELANFFQKQAQRITPSVKVCKIPVAQKHGTAPPEFVKKEMLRSDLIIALPQMSLAHSQARIEAGKRGARFLSLPFYTWDLLDDASLMVNFKAQASVVRKVADAFTKGKSVHVTTQAGTDIMLDIKRRKGNYCPGFVENPGDLGSPPDIEANVSPLENKSEGVVVVDGAIPSAEFGLLKTPIKLIIEKGRIQKFASKNKNYVRILETMFRGATSKRRILAECGVGLNPAAKLTGLMLTDEGALGCVHFGFGSNHTVGGKNKINFHLDFVFKKGSLRVDGQEILKNGRLVE